MNTKIIALTVFAVAASGCSTIANGKNQSVNFTTGAVEGANCMVTGGRDGAVSESFVTPAEVQIRRAKAAIDVECSKAGYQTAKRTVESKMEGTTGGNVLAGGFVGLGVDAMTGAMFKYPDTIVMEMQRIGAAASEMMDQGTVMMDEPITK